MHAPSELKAGLNLEYPQNSLLIDVAAISSRTFPEQFQYAFTLIDSKGQSIKQELSRNAQFTMEGLKPGAYTVNIAVQDPASDRPGSGREVSKTMPFRVSTP